MDGERYLKVAGLPWSVTDEEVINFFADVNIFYPETGLLRVYNADGRFTGEIYLQVASQADFELALAKHNVYMGKRYVEVIPSSKDELDYISRYNKHQPTLEDTILKLRGLPYEAKPEDIYTFFEGYQIVYDGIHFVTKNDRRTGEAFVEFLNPAIAQDALALDKEKIGHRYIELFPSNRMDMESLVFGMGAPRRSRGGAASKSRGGGRGRGGFSGRGRSGRPSPYDKPYVETDYGGFANASSYQPRGGFSRPRGFRGGSRGRSRGY